MQQHFQKQIYLEMQNTVSHIYHHISPTEIDVIRNCVLYCRPMDRIKIEKLLTA